MFKFKFIKKVNKGVEMNNIVEIPERGQRSDIPLSQWGGWHYLGSHIVAPNLTNHF